MDEIDVRTRAEHANSEWGSRGAHVAAILTAAGESQVHWMRYEPGAILGMHSRWATDLGGRTPRHGCGTARGRPLAPGVVRRSDSPICSSSG